MKVKKKALSLILVALMVLSIVPFTSVVANAEDTGVKKIEIGTSGIIDKENYNDKDFVYFGNYENEDIKWKVLDADADNTGTANGMFLLSEYLLEQSNKPFDSESSEWQGSDAQTWCTEFVGSKAFTTAEQSALKGVNKTDAAINNWKTSELKATEDKVFYLSAEEVATYIGSRGAVGLATTTSDGIPGDWWLRSPRSGYTVCVGYVHEEGFVDYIDMRNITIGVRPAFNLNLNSVLFSSAAEGGKSSGAVGADALKSVSEYISDTAKEWKVTLLDTSRNNFTAKLNSASSYTVKAGGSISIDYSNAKTAENEYVSAMLCDADNNVLYYGNIAKSSASGTQTVNIPTNLADGDYELRIFSEQLNGNKKTDYASNFATINFTVNGVQKPAAEFTATSENGGTLTNIGSGMSYSVDGGNSWNTLTGTTATITGVTAEKNIQVKRIRNGTTTSESEVQTITVTQASAPIGLSGTDCTTAANNDGKISGVNSTMEYKLSSESDWRAVEGTELIGLSNGTYQVRVKASGTVLASEAQSITIGAYVAPPAPSVPTAANYTDVDKAITEIPADLSLYTDASVNALNSAVAAVDRNKTQAEQTIVDGYATAIRDAIKALKFKDADYSKVDTVIGKIPADLSVYTDASVKALNDAKNAVVRGKNITEQSTVDGYATAIQKAIDGLVKKTGTAGTNNTNNNNNNDTNKDKNATSPQTGDSSNMLLWLAVLMISAGVILTIRITQKTCKNHSER